MKPLDFHPDAAEEAREVAAHYMAIRVELGAQFQSELDAALARIQDNPLMYAAESGKITSPPRLRRASAATPSRNRQVNWERRAFTTSVILCSPARARTDMSIRKLLLAGLSVGLMACMTAGFFVWRGMHERGYS